MAGDMADATEATTRTTAPEENGSMHDEVRLAGGSTARVGDDAAGPRDAGRSIAEASLEASTVAEAAEAATDAHVVTNAFSIRFKDSLGSRTTHLNFMALQSILGIIDDGRG